MSMEITRVVKVTYPTPVTEAPLRDFAQLRIGAYVTAPGFTSVFMVVGIPDPSHIELQKVPIVAIEGHTHQLTISKGKLVQMCLCGYRLVTVKPDEPLGILQTQGPAAAYILSVPPEATALAPTPGVIYAASTGKLISVQSNGRWPTSTPLFPYLRPVWSVPAAWRGRV